MIKKGFTLAEVLITLGIIGVVTAVTMPVLIQKQNEKATVTRLKKVYSTFSQAYNMAVQEYGTPDEWGFESLSGNKDINSNSSKIIFDNLTKYLKLLKKCTPDNTIECVGKTGDSYTGILSDGTSFTMFSRAGDCSYECGNSMQLKNVCGDIYVYLKGNKPDQQRGKDMFAFHITKFGIFPKGSANDTVFSIARYCYTTDKKYGNYGEACTAWVLYNENMDYLHCDDLSWNGKTKCK